MLYPSDFIVMVKPRKTPPHITEKLLTVMQRIKTKKLQHEIQGGQTHGLPDWVHRLYEPVIGHHR